MVWWKPSTWSNAKVAPEPEERVEDDDEGWFDDPDDDDEVEAEAVEAEQQAPAPRRRKRARDEDVKPTVKWPFSKRETIRLKVCHLVEAENYKRGAVRRACDRVEGASESAMSDGRWIKKFKKYGGAGVLDKRRVRQRRVLTPRRSAAVRDSLRSRRKSGQAAADAERATGRPVSARSVRRLANSSGKFYKKPFRMMVRTPWHARWRLQFAEWALKHIEEDKLNPDDILHGDEKKFCLSADKGGYWVIPNEDGTVVSPNKAKGDNMTDEEYLGWIASLPKALPSTKSHGKYPHFVWGAVGVDMKTPLVFLNKAVTAAPTKGRAAAPKESMTSAIYIERMLPEVLKMKKSRTRGLFRTLKPLWYIQDNDAKHYTPEVKAWLAANDIQLLATPRLDVDGEPDTARGAFGRMVHYPLDDLRFPCYSPDINGAIEKSWREVALRVLERRAEITNDASMKRVIIEEWEGLEFGPTTRPCGRTWIGINALCRMFPKVCKDVVAKGGWDSKYM